MIRGKNTCRGYGITMEVLTGIKMMKGINPIHSYQAVKLPPNTSLKHFVFFPSRWFSFSFSQKRTTCSTYSSVFILVLQRSTYPNPLPWSLGIFFLSKWRLPDSATNLATPPILSSSWVNDHINPVPQKWLVIQTSTIFNRKLGKG